MEPRDGGKLEWLAAHWHESFGIHFGLDVKAAAISRRKSLEESKTRLKVVEGHQEIGVRPPKQFGT